MPDDLKPANPTVTIPDPVPANPPAAPVVTPEKKEAVEPKPGDQPVSVAPPVATTPPPPPPASSDVIFGPAVGDGSGGGKKKIVVTFFIILVLLLIGLGGLFFFGRQNAQPTDTNQVSDEKEQSGDASVSASLTPSESTSSASSSAEKSSKVNLKEYDIRVLNGSGIGGEAAKLQTALQKAGFTVVSVGNADNENYEETVIQANKDVKDTYIKELLKVLEESYTVTPKTASISGTTTADIVVIIGSKKAL